MTDVDDDLAFDFDPAFLSAGLGLLASEEQTALLIRRATGLMPDAPEDDQGLSTWLSGQEQPTARLATIELNPMPPWSLSGNVYLVTVRGRGGKKAHYAFTAEQVRDLRAHLAERGRQRVRLRRIHSAYPHKRR